MEYSVYAIYSRVFDKIYIGFTSDLKARLLSHNHEKNKGWTKRFQPWELIYSEIFQLKADAMKREMQLKSAKGIEYIKSMIIR
jgi:putative endonuclease